MDTYYGPQDVAKLWGVSYRAVLGLINRGKLQAFKAGKEWRISASALRDYETRPITKAVKSTDLKIV